MLMRQKNVKKNSPIGQYASARRKNNNNNSKTILEG